MLPASARDLPPGPDERVRSVVFLHHSYYHFLHLAEALRARGWDALCVSVESPDSPNAPFYHGEDVNLYRADHADYAAALRLALDEIAERFRMLHFAGDGQMSIFPWAFDGGPNRSRIPEDFLRLRAAGVKIGYTNAGCADGIAQSSFRQWSGGMCEKCTLEHKPDFCSDFRNLAWGHKREMFCDLNCAEMLPMLDYQHSPTTFREPLTACLDSRKWTPDIEIPEAHRIERRDEELIVYHGVGNYADSHYSGNRDVKGTPFVVRAIEQLQAEGVPVRLLFMHDVPSRDVRYYQAQADIVVDQLNTGRYGANARESMMLGKPVVGNKRLEEPHGYPPLRSMQECPIVHADEESIFEVLRSLCADRGLRERAGAEARAFALRWHSSDACAARFEVVYDALLAGTSPADVPVLVDGECTQT